MPIRHYDMNLMTNFQHLTIYFSSAKDAFCDKKLWPMILNASPQWIKLFLAFGI